MLISYLNPAEYSRESTHRVQFLTTAGCGCWDCWAWRVTAGRDKLVNQTNSQNRRKCRAGVSAGGILRGRHIPYERDERPNYAAIYLLWMQKRGRGNCGRN